MSIIRRGITIVTVGPAVLLLLQNFYGVVGAVWVLQFIAMLEWTGLKRHLKLSLLDPLISSQRKRFQQLQRLRASLANNTNDTNASSKRVDGETAHTREQEATSLSSVATASPKMRKRHDQPASSSSPSSSFSNSTSSFTPSSSTHQQKQLKRLEQQLEDSSPSLGLFGEPDEDELVVLDDLGPWTDREFPTPIAPVNLFITLKCFACSLIAPLAAMNGESFLLMLTLYFFFWVLLTLLDRNRAEMKQDVARRKIQGLSRTVPSTHSLFQSGSMTTKREKSEEKFVANSVKPLPDSNEFALRELEIVSCYPNVETFVNFTLEYFGFVWIANLAFAVMLFNLGEQGQMVLAVTLFSNWMNDAGALIVGKTLKAIGTGTTHPLYPRISPSKSLEGAVFGILFNAIFAALGAYYFPSVRLNIPNQAAAPKYFFAIGLILGVFGVIGDLLQSLFKRVARIKDTGTIFPGHGGVLDRIDGLVTTIPLAYWLVWGLQKGYLDPLLQP